MVVLGLAAAVGLPVAALAVTSARPSPTLLLRTACGSGLLGPGPSGTGLVAAPPDGTDTGWRFEDAGGGLLRLTLAGRARVAQVQGTALRDGAPVVTAARSGAAAQTWRVTAVPGAGNGSVTIGPAGSSTLVLGTRRGVAQLVPVSTNCSARWTLLPAPAGKPATKPPRPAATSRPKPAARPSARPAAKPSPKPAPTSPRQPAPTASGATAGDGGTLANPRPGNGLAAQIDVPPGAPATGDARVRPVDTSRYPVAGPARDGVGAFRVVCPYSHLAFDDPILAPGRPGASDLNVFFGAASPNDPAGPDGSTCAGGAAEQSGYWVPALYDTRSGQPIAPTFMIAYYTTGYDGMQPGQVVAPPPGLRMVAGSPTALTDGSRRQRGISWGCLNQNLQQASIPLQCGAGDMVTLSVTFPQCWDGRHLDAPDHHSHLAFPVNGGCPADHPVPLPQLTINVRYQVHAPGEQQFWRLSSDHYGADRPGGLSLTGAWTNGWDPAVEQAWVDNCERRALDCTNQLGDGRELF